MELGILGPLTARADGTDLGLGSRKQRTVLGLLAVNPGQAVSLDELVDEIWPSGPPASAVANVRGYAGSLRRSSRRRSPVVGGWPDPDRDTSCTPRRTRWMFWAS